MTTPDKAGRSVTILLDCAVYGEEAVLRAAHRLTGRAFVSVEQVPTGGLSVTLTPRDATDDPQQLRGVFLNEALDQRLRERLEKQTEPLRRLIIAQAFSKVDLFHPELDTPEPEDDPARIGVPDPRG